MLIQRYARCVAANFAWMGSHRRFKGATCCAFYFGGGTASLLAPGDVGFILEEASSQFSLDPTAEITLEGNPLDYHPTYLADIVATGVNRLSIGVQSFSDGTLAMAGTTHRAKDSHNAASAASRAGFRSFNIDLMYGLPGQELSQWQSDVATAVEYDPQSISTFKYKIHPGSLAEWQLIEGRARPQPAGADLFNWYRWTRDLLLSRGYQEGRKGAFHRPGFRQRYNRLTYAAGYELIGLGAGAYGFVNGRVWVGPESADAYMERAERGEFPVVDNVSPKATRPQVLMRSLVGAFMAPELDRGWFKDRFSVDPVDAFPEVFADLEFRHWVNVSPDRLQVTELGLFQQEQILAVLHNSVFGRTMESV